MAEGRHVWVKFVKPLLFSSGTLLLASLVVFGTRGGVIQASEREQEVPSQVLAADAAPVTSTLTLNRALTLAAKNHPTVREAKLDEEAMKISYAQQSAAYRPKLNARTDAIWFGVGKESKSSMWVSKFKSGLTSERAVQIGAGWQLPGGPVLSANVIIQDESEMDSNANALTLSSRWNLWPGIRAEDAYDAWRTTEETLRDEPIRTTTAINEALIDTYRRFRSLQIERYRLGLQVQSLTSHEEKLAVTILQVQRGLLSDHDRTLAEIDRDRSVASVERAKAHYERQQAQLADDLGVGSISLPELPDDFDHIPWALSYDETTERAIRASATYASGVRDLRAAQRKADNANRDNGLNAYLVADVSIKRWSGSPAYSTFVRVEYDMLDGGAREANRALADLQAQRTGNALEEIRNNVARDVSSRLTDMAWLEKEVIWAKQAYTQAKTIHEIKKEQLAKGLIVEGDIVSDAHAEGDALIKWIEAYTDYETARLSLLNMAGLPLLIEGTFLVNR